MFVFWKGKHGSVQLWDILETTDFWKLTETVLETPVLGPTGLKPKVWLSVVNGRPGERGEGDRNIDVHRIVDTGWKMVWVVDDPFVGTLRAVNNGGPVEDLTRD